uniref:GIY-YIG endonuclease n=1 Tax=Tolypocladium cylindrosporum TaxID=38005 RepID=A0A6G7P045_9HYPO|nr:GIY-YIG endonuclease [Tolypocladium cylindrosporum]QIJ60539.1 GIY-YIG endonuclease [Tolypocladium cylindrosporum]
MHYQTHNKNKQVTPIVYYNDPYENRADIYKYNNNKSGIYRWCNLINNKCYIGSANNLRNRFYQYLSISNITNELLKYNSNIYKALLKYKYNNFRLEILEYSEINDLIKLEQYYIDLLKPEYNILPQAGSTLGYKHTLASLNKLKNYKPTSEALAKLRLAKTLSGTVLVVINKKNNNITKYPSIREAARNLNVTHAGLMYCMNKNILLKDTYLIIKLMKIKF